MTSTASRLVYTKRLHQNLSTSANRKEPTPDTKKRTDTTQYIWATICFLSIGNFNIEIVPSIIPDVPVNQIIFGSIISIYSLIFLINKVNTDFKKSTILLLISLTALSSISFIWSDDKAHTAIRGVSFLLLIPALSVIIRNMSGYDILKGVLFGTFLASIASIVLIFIYPDIAGRGVVYASQDSWRGIFYQKNVLGRCSMLLICASFVLWRERVVKLYIFLLSAMISIFLAFKSQSYTSLVGIAIFPFIYKFVLILLKINYRNVYIYISLILLSLFSIIIFIVMFQDGILHLVGKDISITGRVPLWVESLQDWVKRPFLGYGVGSYFDDYRIQRNIYNLGWDADNAHNGFLELLLDLGIVGFFLFFGCLISLIRSTSKLSSHDDGASEFVIFILCIILLQNLTESVLMRPTNCIWICFVIACLLVSKINRPIISSRSDRDSR